MRHGDKINNLGRKSAHRKSLLSNLASQLILKKRINTTVAKAKALRSFVEPLLTKSKNDSTHSRRVVFAHLGNKSAVDTLFKEVSNKIAERNGGYTRILKTGNRLGDNAEMCLIELVDYNENRTGGKTPVKAKASRRGKKKSGAKQIDAETATEITDTNNEETKSE